MFNCLVKQSFFFGHPRQQTNLTPSSKGQDMNRLLRIRSEMTWAACEFVSGFHREASEMTWVL